MNEKHAPKLVATAALMGAMLASEQAQAQLWHPVDAKERANFVMAVDLSAPNDATAGCAYPTCSIKVVQQTVTTIAYNDLGSGVWEDSTGVMGAFRQDFIWSGFNYTAARNRDAAAFGKNQGRYAQIVDDVCPGGAGCLNASVYSPVFPPTNPAPGGNEYTAATSSYDGREQDVNAMNGMNQCHGAKGFLACREMQAAPSSAPPVCLSNSPPPATPDPGIPACVNDLKAIKTILAYYSDPAHFSGGIRFPPLPQTATPCDYNHPILVGQGRPGNPCAAPPNGPGCPGALDGGCPGNCPNPTNLDTLDSGNFAFPGVFCQETNTNSMPGCGGGCGLLQLDCGYWWHNPYAAQQSIGATVPLNYFDPEFEWFHEFANWQWPRYAGNTPSRWDEICRVINNGIRNFKTRVDKCLVNPRARNYFDAYNQTGWAGGNLVQWDPDCDPDNDPTNGIQGCSREVWCAPGALNPSACSGGYGAGCENSNTSPWNCGRWGLKYTDVDTGNAIGDYSYPSNALPATCLCTDGGQCGPMGNPDDCSKSLNLPGAMNDWDPNTSGGWLSPGAYGVPFFTSQSLIVKSRQQVAMCYSHRPFTGWDGSLPPMVGSPIESHSRLPNAFGDPERFEPRYRENLLHQTDNRLSESAGGQCRDNVIGYFTDGFGGSDASTTNKHAALVKHAPQQGWLYKSARLDGTFTPESHVFITRQGGFQGQADIMQRTVSFDARTRAWPVYAAEAGYGYAAMAAMTNRIYGPDTYSSAPLAFDRYGTRVAVVNFEVPGVYTSSRDYSGYLGYPARISWYELNPDGSFGRLLWETDWTDRIARKRSVFSGTSGTGAGGMAQPAYIQGAGGHSNTAYTLTGILGGNFNPETDRWPASPAFAEQVPMDLAFNSTDMLDRDGDKRCSVCAAGSDPGEQPRTVTWGSLIGGERTKPIVVEAPRDPPSAKARTFAQWQNLTRIQQRPRVIYTLSNYAVHAIHAGTFSPTTTTLTQNFGTLTSRQFLRFGYNDCLPTASIGGCASSVDSANRAGTELWRYRPSFLNALPTHVKEDMVKYAGMKPFLSGQLAVREMQWNAAPGTTLALYDYRTILVAMQGEGGSGVVGIDISNPVPGGLGAAGANPPSFNGTKALFDLSLPNLASATSEPVLMQWPDTAGTNRAAPTLVVTSGWRGEQGFGSRDRRYSSGVLNHSGSILAYNMRSLAAANTTPMASATLPVANRMFPSGPACIDVGDRIACYAVDNQGFLWRTYTQSTVSPYTAFSFAPLANLNTSPQIKTGHFDPVTHFGAPYRYWTKPAVYFDNNNRVNIVYGSGDITNLRMSTTGDRVYHAVDSQVTAGSVGTQGVLWTADVCVNAAGSTAGAIPLSCNGQPCRMVSPPVVGRGLVAWTAYVPPSSSCQKGESFLFAMNAESCEDAFAPPGTTTRPTGRSLGAQSGIAPSPSVLRRTGKVLAHATSQNSGQEIDAANAAVSGGGGAADGAMRGNQLKPILRLFFFRNVSVR